MDGVNMGWWMVVRKMIAWSAAAVVFVALLAGCAGGDTSRETESGLPATGGGAAESTPGLRSTDEGPSQTSEPADGASQATEAGGAGLINLGTPVPQPTPEAVGESIMATELTGAPLRSPGGIEGSVRGLMLDVVSGTARYLVVEAGSTRQPELYLLPWNVLTIARIIPEKSTDVNAEENSLPELEFSLTAETPLAGGSQGQGDQDLPILEPQALDIWQKSGTLPEDWDAAARRFWAAQLLDNQISGSGGDESSPVFFVGKQAQQEENLFGADRWKVQDEDQNEIGRVEEIFFSPQGQAVIAALVLPDFRGQGEALHVVVPWKRLVWSRDERTFTVAASLDMLAEAPVFNRDELPDISVPGWEEDWLSYWEQDRSTSSQPPTPVPQIGQTLVTRLIGTRLDDAAGNQLGQVEDLVIGPDGNILYLVLKVNDLMRPVPWMMFDYANGKLIYIDDTARLLDAPGYRSASAIDPSIANWDKELRSYWGLGR